MGEEPSERAPATPSEPAPATPSERAPATPSERAPATPSERAPATPSERAPATPSERAQRDEEQLLRLAAVMHRLRRECPWDAEQTHRSLVHYLVEETCEVVDAIESGGDADLREELGDLLLQVYFHAAIAEQEGRFTLDDVARGIADKLVERHPYVFAGGDVPDDLNATWEANKRATKGRTSSLDGIPLRLSALARANKVVSRARSHHVAVDLPDEPVTADEVGRVALELVARAQASGVDPEQAVRDALRGLEDRVRVAERPA